MTTTRLMTLLLVILAIAGWSNESVFAQTMTLTIDFGGQCGAMTKTGDPTTAPVVLTIVPANSQAPCGNYVIQPKTPAVPVTLETGIDSGNDTLTLKNAKITKAPGSWLDLHITITGANKYQPIPSAIPPGPSVGYKVTATGLFKRGSTINPATDSYIKTRGFQENPTLTAPWFWLGLTPPSATNGIELNWTVGGANGNTLPGSYEAHSVWNPGQTTLAATRDLKAEFWVKLNDNTDALNLTELKVFHYLPGGGVLTGEAGHTLECPIEQCVPCQENSPECKHEPDTTNP